MVDNTVDAKWYAQYTTHVANNVLNREGQVRFSYRQLRSSLDAIKNNITPDKACLELFAKIIEAMPTVTIDDNQERTLFLLLLNIHMAYGLISGYTLDEDSSIGTTG